MSGIMDFRWDWFLPECYRVLLQLYQHQYQHRAGGHEKRSMAWYSMLVAYSQDYRKQQQKDISKEGTDSYGGRIC